MFVHVLVNLLQFGFSKLHIEIEVEFIEIDHVKLSPIHSPSKYEISQT